MAVVIETTLGDITVDLYIQRRPQTCRNFLKLCKIKYYNYNLFHSISSGFIAQTGDPTGEGSGGESIWGVLEGPKKRFFTGEKMPKIRHSEVGLLSMVCTDDMLVGSQFFFTLAPDLDSLDGTHCVIGEVTEGHEVLTKLNEVICDEGHRPYRDVRITHTVILEDPFVDPPAFRAPSRSPSPNPERLKGGRIAPDENIDETESKSAAEIQEMIQEKEAKARATILEIVGDLPDADIAPPENVLFVCKLNPVTTDDDLEIIFSRFGKIVSCEVICDKKTGNSLQYAFIEFDNKKSCENAYFKMDNVLIDDRRIHVDFSQSVSKMRYLGKGRGVQYLNDDSSEANIDKKSKFNQSPTHGHEKRKNRQDHSRKYDNHKNYQKRSHNRDHTNEHNQHIKKSQRNRSRSCSPMHNSREGNRDSKSKIRKENYENLKRDSYRYAKNPHRSSSSCNARRRRDSTPSHDKKNNIEDCINDRSYPKYIEKSDKKHSSHSRDRKSSRTGSSTPNIVESYDKHKGHEQISQKHQKSYNNHTSENRRKNNDSHVDEKYYQKTKNSSYREKDVEPKTPSPIVEKKKIKSNKSKKTEKGTKSAKNQRKVSTSSSSDSSTESSSSSDSSSSSSDSDRRKKRRKRKSSSSSTSSSSSSSSTSSGSTSSSDSEDHSRKRKKVQSRKPMKKSKK